MGFGTSILAGSLTLGILTLPVVISTAEEAINSVPRQFRTVSLSLGATRWQTIRYQVLPHALPGIITGVISVLIVLILAAGALRWYAKLTGEASSEDSEEWNQMLTEDQNGEAIMIK